MAAFRLYKVRTYICYLKSSFDTGKNDAMFPSMNVFTLF